MADVEFIYEMKKQTPLGVHWGTVVQPKTYANIGAPSVRQRDRISEVASWKITSKLQNSSCLARLVEV